MPSRHLLLVGVAIAFLLMTVDAFAAPTNMLSNPGFETPAIGVNPGTPVTYTSLCNGGTSAAGVWLVWVNACNSYMSTVLLPSTLPGGGNYMIEVTTDGNANGLWQQYLPTNTGPVSAFGSAWVYLNSGCVGIGIGNDGNTGTTSSTCVVGQWIQLTTLNGVSPANEFIVYTTTASGADYYVDNAWVSAVPEPASITMLVAGAGVALRRSLRNAR